MQPLGKDTLVANTGLNVKKHSFQAVILLFWWNKNNLVEDNQSAGETESRFL